MNQQILIAIGDKVSLKQGQPCSFNNKVRGHVVTCDNKVARIAVAEDLDEELTEFVRELADVSLLLSYSIGSIQ